MESNSFRGSAVTVLKVLGWVIGIALAAIAALAAIFSIPEGGSPKFAACMRAPLDCPRILVEFLGQEPKPESSAPSTPTPAPKPAETKSAQTTPNVIARPQAGDQRPSGAAPAASPSAPTPNVAALPPDPKPVPQIREQRVELYVSTARPLCGEAGWRAYQSRIRRGQWVLGQDNAHPDSPPIYVEIGGAVEIGRCRLTLKSVEPQGLAGTDFRLEFVEERRK